MEVILIAAMSVNRVIGRWQAIPWHIPGEQLRFKKVTMGHSLIMGRKTFESIGRPLLGRENIIISRNKQYKATGCAVVDSLKAALALSAGADKVFVIGGEQIFKQALPFAQTIILTTIQRRIEGDIYFPVFDGFKNISVEKIDGRVPYVIELFRREGPLP
jgi:dihydrofolate reductase